MPLPTRIGRLRPPVLCFVVTPDVKDIEATVTAAVAGGVTMVQLRDRQAPAGRLYQLARRLKTITRGKALLVINDRVDVAIAVEADGAQLPEDGLPTLAARGLIGKQAVLGRSIHSLEAATQAAREGADFVIAGTIYKTTSKPDAKGVGPGLITEITNASSMPVLAIGGVTAERVAEVVRAGAAGVAVISAIAGAADPKAAAEALSKALAEAWAARDEKVAATA